MAVMCPVWPTVSTAMRVTLPMPHQWHMDVSPGCACKQNDPGEAHLGQHGGAQVDGGDVPSVADSLRGLGGHIAHDASVTHNFIPRMHLQAG